MPLSAPPTLSKIPIVSSSIVKPAWLRGSFEHRRRSDPAQSRTLFVLRCAEPCCGGVLFAHVGAALRLSVIAVTGVVVDFRIQIDPNHSIGRTARLRGGFGRKFIGRGRCSSRFGGCLGRRRGRRRGRWSGRRSGSRRLRRRSGRRGRWSCPLGQAFLFEVPKFYSFGLVR